MLNTRKKAHNESEKLGKHVTGQNVQEQSQGEGVDVKVTLRVELETLVVELFGVAVVLSGQTVSVLDHIARGI